MTGLNESRVRPDLSVVIACFNGARHIHAQLTALSGEVPDFEWEVIVADNGSGDCSIDICRSFDDRLRIRVVEARSRRGQSFARNQGAAVALGRKLLFLDQDDVIEAGYVAAMAAALDRAGLVAATMEYDQLNSEWAKQARASAVARGIRPGLYPWAYGCVLGVTREVFDAVGGFDEDLPCSEDVDFCWRVARCDTDLMVRHVPEAVLHYRLRETVGGVFRQGMLYGRGGAALYKRWAEDGMSRRSLRHAIRSWAGIVRGLLGRDSQRAHSIYLLGNRIGCIAGSLRERVLYL